MKSPLTLLVVLLWSAHFARADEAQDWMAIDRIEKTLKGIVLSKFEFHDAKLQDVLNYCDQELRTHEKGRVAIPIMVDLYWDPPLYGPAAPMPVTSTITVVLTNPSLYEALQYASGLANLRLSIRPDGIHVTLFEDTSYLFTREFQIPAEFFRSVPLGTSDRAEFVKSIVLGYIPAVWPRMEPSDGQRKCVFNTSATRMVIRDTKESLENIGKSLTFPRTPSIPGPDVPKVLGAEEEAKVKQAWQKIILPKVSFQQTPLEHVVVVLNRWCSQESMNQSGGLFYEKPGPRLPPFEASSQRTDPKITYTAEHISAWDALQAIARLADLEVSTISRGLRLVSRDTAYTRDYLIPPEAWPQALAKSPPLYAGGREGGKEWLTSGGVRLAEGTHFGFAFKDRTLTVFNTLAEHQKIQAMVEKAWRTYYATRKDGKGKAQEETPDTSDNWRASSAGLVPKEEREPMFERDFAIPRDFFPAYEKQDRLDHTHVAREMRKDIRRFLAEHGIIFDEGATARINSNGTRLTARQTEGQLQDIAYILEGVRPPCVFPSYDLKTPKIITHGDNAALMRKVQRIILPEVKFADTRVIDALEILHDLSVRYDTESPHGDRGVKIVFEEDGHPVAASPWRPNHNDDPNAEYVSRPMYERELDYAAAQVTLLDALEAVARRGNWAVDIGSSVVTLRAPARGGATITQTYLLPPDEAARIHAKSHSRAGQCGDDPIEELLRASPAGSSILYQADTSRLTIRSSEENQRRTQGWITEMWRGYYATQQTEKGVARKGAD